MESIDPDKYIVFKREDFLMWLGGMTTQDLRDVVVPSLLAEVDAIALPDAVVIRRQDLFAGPALHAYANNMAMAARMVSESDIQKRLLNIADFFHEQAVLSDEVSGKLPD